MRNRFKFLKDKIYLILLLLILGIVALPYLLQIPQKISELQSSIKSARVDKTLYQFRQQINQLLLDYKIKSVSCKVGHLVSNDGYVVDCRVSDNLISYFNLQEKIKNNNDDEFTCENPPKPEVYKTNSQYFPEDFLLKSKVQSFLEDCKRIKYLEPFYNEFHITDVPNIEKLVEDSKKSDSEIIIFLGNRLEELLQQPNKESIF